MAIPATLCIGRRSDDYTWDLQIMFPISKGYEREENHLAIKTATGPLEASQSPCRIGFVNLLTRRPAAPATSPVVC